MHQAHELAFSTNLRPDTAVRQEKASEEEAHDTVAPKDPSEESVPVVT